MEALSEVLRAVKLTGAVFLSAEAAFNRAFRRESGMPPARWRRGDTGAAPGRSQ